MAAPKHLSRTAKAWFKKIQDEFEIQDETGKLLLQTAFEAYDRMKEAQETISNDGPVILDRFEQKKAHPLLSIERDSRAQMLAALKQLNLDLEPLQDKPGRPPGR
jgi:P27 family predicted phage terminase small subunit